MTTSSEYQKLADEAAARSDYDACRYWEGLVGSAYFSGGLRELGREAELERKSYENTRESYEEVREARGRIWYNARVFGWW